MTPQAARLVVASAVSAAVVLAAPLMGQIRGALRAALPDQFVTIVGGAVAVSLACLVGAALVRIRERRLARYGAMAAAIGIAAAYSLATRTGIPYVDVVERVHFIEYGVITFLFYRAWKTNADPSVFALPFLAGFLVGTLDEWLQWFVPNRVGEIRDLLLNLVAIGCGLLFGIGVEPPVGLRRSMQPRSVRWLRGLAVVAVLAFGGFVSAVHLGKVVADEEIGTFRSHYSKDELRALSAERAERWRTDPPLVLKRWSREDQYMDEGLWHVRRRNDLWAERQYVRAWRENLILERYFAPVLDTPSYAVPGGSRWSAEQRAVGAVRSATGGLSTFVSDAHPYPLVIWPKAGLWTAVGLLAAAAALLGKGRAQ